MKFGGTICVTVPNYMPIGQSIAMIWPVLDFWREKRSTNLHLL